MGKKMKLKIGELKVQSFVTSEEISEVKGGATYPCCGTVGTYCCSPDYICTPLGGCYHTCGYDTGCPGNCTDGGPNCDTGPINTCRGPGCLTDGVNPPANSC